MSSLNKVTLIGRVGKDPEKLKFSNGGEVVNFTLATSEKYKNKSGESVENTQWHNIACFAEGLNKIIMQYVKKGSQVYLEGSIETTKKNDKYYTKVVLKQFNSTLILLDSKSNSKDSGQNSQSQNQDYQHGLDDDIPF